MAVVGLLPEVACGFPSPLSPALDIESRSAPEQFPTLSYPRYPRSSLASSSPAAEANSAMAFSAGGSGRSEASCSGGGGVDAVVLQDGWEEGGADAEVFK